MLLIFSLKELRHLSMQLFLAILSGFFLGGLDEHVDNQKKHQGTDPKHQKRNCLLVHTFPFVMQNGEFSG